MRWLCEHARGAHDGQRVDTAEKCSVPLQSRSWNPGPPRSHTRSLPGRKENVCDRIVQTFVLITFTSKDLPGPSSPPPPPT